MTSNSVQLKRNYYGGGEERGGKGKRCRGSAARYPESQRELREVVLSAC